MTFNTLNRKFYNDFVRYFNDKGSALNSIGAQIKNVKAFAKEAVKRGYKVHPDVHSFKRLSEETDKVYLTMDELSLIDAIDLSSWPTLEKARDLFLFDCFTGFRYSDLKNFKQEYLSDDFIRITSEKNGVKVVIPLHPIARKVLQKYNQVLPRLVNNTKFNERIKEI